MSPKTVPLQHMDGEFGSYLKTLRSEATRYCYDRWIRFAVGDPDAFLKLARTDRQAGCREDSLQLHLRAEEKGRGFNAPELQGGGERVP